MNKNILRVCMLAAMCCAAGSQAYALDDVDGVYQISTAADLVEFSDIVADGEASAAGVLLNDIDMSDVDYTPIGTQDVPYTGTFDGQCHYVRNLEIDTAKDYQGIFGAVGTCTVKNLILDENSYIGGGDFVGGIIGGSIGSCTVTIENCGNEGEIEASGANAAGIIGVSYLSNGSFVISNCFNTGVITGARESAAITGWCGGDSYITNCYNAGTVSGMDGTNSMYRNSSVTATNLYDTYGYQGTIIYTDALSTGEAAYTMNNNGALSIWYQTLGEDDHPVPFSTHGTVYAVGELYCDGTPKSSTVTYSNSDESVRDDHDYVNGICSACGTADTSYCEQNEDGYYLISSDVELNWFAALINTTDQYADALLTADIDFADYTLEDVMIGIDGYPFRGVFDGGCHSIYIEYDRSEDYCGLFGWLNAATICNLEVTGYIETSERYAGGLFSYSDGATLIENVLVSVDIEGTYSGDATHGGFCSNARDNIIFRNCAYTGTIEADKSYGNGGIMGYSHGNNEQLFQNVYVSGDLYFSSDGSNDAIARNAPIMDNCYYVGGTYTCSYATEVEESTVDSGELCFILNGYVSGGDDWTQTIGTDAGPVPFLTHSLVYAVGTVNCDGKPTSTTTYSNTDDGTRYNEHNYVDGVCSNCGGYYITTADQLAALAEDIKAGSVSSDVTIELGNDIDFDGIDDYACIGTEDYPYTGSFDGNGYRIYNMIIEDLEEGYKGLFGFVGGGATIKNVIIDSSCDIYSTQYCAGIVGATGVNYGLVRIENCGNEADVTAFGANAAGILGVAVLGYTMIYMTNCYNTGTITGEEESAAISGWLGVRAKLTNCYNIGEVAASGVDGSNTFARATSVEFNNCYEYDLYGLQTTTVTSSQITGGELCYLLNGSSSEDPAFYQTIGTDSYPLLEDTHGVVYYDGTNYYNDATGIETVETEVNGEATVSGIWSVSGAKLPTMQSGLNIVRMSDGTVRKVIVR